MDLLAPVNHNIHNISSITRQSLSLLADIVSDTNGTLSIEVPRALLDSKQQDNTDYPFEVLVEGRNVSYNERD